MKITGRNPYKEIIKIIEDWCNRNWWEDMIAEIVIDGEVTNEILLCEGNGSYLVFNNDWYEGQEEIELTAFAPISEIKVTSEAGHRKKEGEQHDEVRDNARDSA